MTTQTATFVTVTEFREAIAELKARVMGLENLANRLGYTVDVPETESVPESVSDADTPSVQVPVSTAYDMTAPRAEVPSNLGERGQFSATAPASGVDYAAVAYGLTTLKAKIESALGRSAEVNRTYADAVDWFASCFSGDASFNATAFRTAAGV